MIKQLTWCAEVNRFSEDFLQVWIIQWLHCASSCTSSGTSSLSFCDIIGMTPLHQLCRGLGTSTKSAIIKCSCSIWNNQVIEVSIKLEWKNILLWLHIYSFNILCFMVFICIDYADELSNPGCCGQVVKASDCWHTGTRV